MTKHNILLYTLLLSLYSLETAANLTTLQYWDPSPIYSANNFMMPSNSHITNLRKAKRKNMKPAHNRCFSASFTGLVQGACRARDNSNCVDFGTVCGQTANGKELGDFRGTMYPFGLFLGNSPNGNNIWASGFDDAKIGNITPNSINGTQLPTCIKDIAKQLSGNFEPSTGLPTPSGDTLTTPAQAMIVGPIEDLTVADVSTITMPLPLPDGPSLFSADSLKVDTSCFGSFSLPLDYRKYAIRLELHADFSENIGITIQTGLANIKQKTTGIYSLSNTSTDTGNCDLISPVLTFQGVNGNSTTDPIIEQVTPENTIPIAQNIYNIFFIQRINRILDPDCGINQSVNDFDDYSLEDVRFLITFKETHEFERYFQEEDIDESWPEMLFTVYGWVGASAPVAEPKDYSKYLSLPFGNNKHPSVGVGLGFAYDFVESVEVGAEVGCTYFISRQETRPFPNHRLQRGLYPFNAEVTSKPGLNWHFKAILNAYQFMKHVNFWATYEFIEHNKDEYILKFDNSIKRINPNTMTTIEERVFIPEVLENLSEWRAQFINLGVVFDLQPGVQAGITWQQPISPRNAYYPVSVVGSFSFTF